MSLLDGIASDEARAESILAKLGAEEAAPEETPAAQPTEAEPAAEAPAQEAEESGPEETPVTEGEEGQSDPAEPVIEPPDSWKAEAKERFKTLPRDLQAVIAERDAEQKAAFNRQVNEAAERNRAAEAARKAAEERVAAAAQEQQRYAQTLAAFQQQAEQADPVIATYNRLLASGELVQLAREKPAEYGEFMAQYATRKNALDAMRAEQQRVAQEAMRGHFAREERALVEKLPDWADQTVAHKALHDLRQVAIAEYGYRPDEVQTIADHRLVLMMRDASEAKTLRAKVAELEARIAEKDKGAKAAITQKKVQPAPTKVMRPNSASENAAKVESERSKAIIKKAKAIRDPHERAALLATVFKE